MGAVGAVGVVVLAVVVGGIVEARGKNGAHKVRAADEEETGAQLVAGEESSLRAGYESSKCYVK